MTCTPWSVLSKHPSVFTVSLVFSLKCEALPQVHFSPLHFHFLSFPSLESQRDLALSLPQISAALAGHCVSSVCFQGENRKACHRSNSWVCFPRKGSETPLPCAASSVEKTEPEDEVFKILGLRTKHLPNSPSHRRTNQTTGGRQDPGRKPSEP